MPSTRATSTPRAKEIPGATTIRRRNRDLDARLIESRLEEHPDVLEAEVVGRPLKRRGRAIWAFVLLKPDAALKEKTAQLGSVLGPWVREALPAYMVPDHYRAVLKWPLSPKGAVNRWKLAARVRTGEQQMKRVQVPRTRGPLNQIIFEGVITDLDMIARVFTIAHRTEDGTTRSACFRTSRKLYETLKKGKYFEVTGCFSDKGRVVAMVITPKEPAVRISLANTEAILERLA